MRQQDDWTCAAAALNHLLERFNIRISQTRLDNLLDQNPDTKIGADKGVSHDDIVRVLKDHLELWFVSHSDSTLGMLLQHLPALVNFQREGDGHYGVAETWSDNGLVVWDPWTGGNLWYPGWHWETIWYSRLYGARWWLHIPLRQATRFGEVRPDAIHK